VRFLEVFPHVTLWTTELHEMLLIGSIAPIQIDATQIANHFGRSGVSAALGEVGIESPAALLAIYMSDRAGLERYVGDAPATTDDRPRIEYSAWLRRGEFARVPSRVLALHTDPPLGNATEPFMAEIPMERRRPMYLYPTAKSTAKSGESRGLEGTQRHRFLMKLVISIGVCVGSNPTSSAI
jgi:spermidine synthase